MEQRFSYTKSCDERSIRDTIKKVKMPKNSFVVFFASSNFDFHLVAKLVEEELQGIPNIGCVSTGEITPEGYIDGTFSIFSVYSPDFNAKPIILTDLEKRVMLYKRRISNALSDIGLDINDSHCTEKFFVLSLIDAFAACEERMSTLLRNLFGQRKLNSVGGSAGNLGSGYSYVAINGRVESNAAVLLFVKTTKKIMLYNENIYNIKGNMHMVTESDFISRTVYKADDIPFLDLYSKEIGVPKDKIDSNVFAKNPIGRVSNGRTYIASPLKVNSNDSITFYTRVLAGRQFYFMEASDLIEVTKETANEIKNNFRKVDLVIGFNCILRFLQMQNEGTCRKAYEAICDITNAPYFGFTTLGEQIETMHANQTLTLIALGE